MNTECLPAYESMRRDNDNDNEWILVNRSTPTLSIPSNNTTRLSPPPPPYSTMSKNWTETVIIGPYKTPDEIEECTRQYYNAAVLRGLFPSNPLLIDCEVSGSNLFYTDPPRGITLKFDHQSIDTGVVCHYASCTCTLCNRTLKFKDPKTGMYVNPEECRNMIQRHFQSTECFETHRKKIRLERHNKLVAERAKDLDITDMFLEDLLIKDVADARKRNMRRVEIVFFGTYVPFGDDYKDQVYRDAVVMAARKHTDKHPDWSVVVENNTVFIDLAKV